MGRAIPVGSLMLTRPVAITSPRVGDVITYRTRTCLVELYTHRVVTLYPDGTVQVRGDINGAADPYPVQSSDLIGIVVRHWRLLGWLIQAAPIVAAVVVALLLASGRWIPLRWRSSVRVIGVCVAVTSLILQPFVHPILMGVGADGQQSWGSVVSGGLLPTRVTGADQQFVDLVTGADRRRRRPGDRSGGPVMINGRPHLTD